MRWTTYVSPSDATEHVGLAEGDALYGVRSATSMLEALAHGRDGLTELRAAALANPFEVVPLAGTPLRAPLPIPPSIRDFMAFEEHVVTSSKALGHTVEPVWYEQPIFYFTNPAAVHGPSDDVAIAPGSLHFDYELEIAVVIGAPGSDLDPSTAEDHIAGYLVFCDWSARDLQSREMRGNLGPAKAKDSATSFGPYLVTPDELEGRRAGNGYDLEMTAAVNGDIWSRGNLSTIYWNFGQMLAYASRGTTLRTGDVIASGTVGTGCILELSRVHGTEAYPWLKAGDRVHLEIELLGAIEATIVPGRPVVPIDR